jgi:hypothetical protein
LASFWSKLRREAERAQALLSERLARLLDRWPRGNAPAARAQRGTAEVVAQVADEDRRVVTMDSLPLWDTLRDRDVREPVATGMRRSLEMERAFIADADAAHARLLPALGAAALVLLALVFPLRRRARALVGAGQLRESALQALARPWAAWLLLVAGIAVAYGLQGPHLRQQVVMLLAWVPVLALVQQRMLRVVGPWAYLSAAFYLASVIVALLVGNPLLHRLLLLALTLLMLLALAMNLLRVRRSDGSSEFRFQANSWQLVGWAACGVLFVAAGSNLAGNVTLAAMLASATLDSSYAALAIYAGSKVALALFQVLLVGPTAARLQARYSSSLAPALINFGRAGLVAVWLLFTLQSFRIYRPVSSFVMTVLTHEFKLGELSLSIGGLLSFLLAAWVAFWLAKTIRQVLAEDILPSLALPRGDTVEVAGKVVNWTLHGTRRRIEITVSTPYAADPKRTLELLTDIARSVKGVATTPAPSAIIVGLAPGEMQFSIRAWTQEFVDWVDMRTELAVKVRDGLAAAGIEVPRPQRELVVRGAMPHELTPAAGPAPAADPAG